MRRLSIMGLTAAVLLAACGGDTITGTTTTSTSTTGTGTTTPSSTVSALTVSTSTASIAADGSTSATITAIAKDANNNLVSGVAVAFGSTGGVLQITQATTDSSGQAIATIAAGQTAAGTSITVNASSGTVKGSVAVTVVATQQTIVLTTSSPQIPSDASKPATITAALLNASNQLVPGVVVNFTASAGGALSTTQSTTSASGIATAILTPSSKATQTVTVTATAGSATTTLPVNVTGTTLLLVGPTSLTSTSPAASYTVSLTDSSTAGIANQTVALTASPAAGITFSPSSVVTDSTGKATVTVMPGTVGTYTLTATAFGGLNVGSAPITVSAQQFQITPAASASTKVDLVGSPVTATSYPTSQTLTVTWKDNSGAVVAGQTVNFSTTRGAFGANGTTPASVSAVTNSAGQASATIYSTVAGPATVTASATDPATLTAVTTNTSIDFVATVPSAIAVQASPATVAALGQSTITAVVRDASNNLVEGQTVNFSNSTDVTKGTLSVASAVTDDQGRAQTVYTASSTTSATNGVVIVATVDGTTVTGSANLTVGGLTVFLSLGTGNKVGENTAQTQFIEPYSVQAVDAAGNPVPNVPITLTIHPLVYSKGGYIATSTTWVQTGTPNQGTLTAIKNCPNEDATSAYAPAQFNGVLDPGEDGCTSSGNDNVTGLPVTSPYTCNAFGNGNRKLDPGGTAIASPSSVTTSASGSADFSVIYPEDQALWVEVELIATATASGTETTASATFVLPMLSTYLTDLTSNPPGDPSPYGIATSCTNPN